MTDFVKTISQQVASQFPAIYREEGENLIAFLEAYYEFLETTDEYSLKLNRNIFEYRDIDTTLDEFVVHFKEKYLKGLPFNNNIDNRFLTKHIVDFYRSKGSEQSIKLLMRVMFGDEVNVYYPAIDILKPSDSKWVEPKYLETAWSPTLYSLVDKQVTGTKSGAKAFVEKIIKRNINGSFIYLVYLSNIRGNFTKDDLLVTSSGIIADAPKVLGSLNSITISTSDGGFSIGDVLSVESVNGIDGTARVTATLGATNKVTYRLIDGGYGYTLDTNTELYVSNSILYLDNANLSFVELETITQGSNTAIVVGQNTTAIGVYSNTDVFIANTAIVANSVSYDVINVEDRGANTSFEIGSLKYPETVTINTDQLSTYAALPINSTAYGLPLAPAANSSSVINTALTYISMEIGAIQILNKLAPGANYYANPFVYVVNPYISVANRKDIILYVTGTNGTFLLGEVVTHSNGAKGVVKSFSAQTGILKLKNIYYTKNFVIGGTVSSTSGDATVNDYIEDSDSVGMGENASIIADVVGADGFISTIEVLNSGLGYVNGASVNLVGTDRNATGISYTDSFGEGEGYWETTNSHLNSEKKIRDNDYYQEYSYEIISGIDISKYRDIIKEVVHVSGTKFFGKVERKTSITADYNSESSVVQA